jgi:hypothetical protein
LEQRTPSTAWVSTKWQGASNIRAANISRDSCITGTPETLESSITEDMSAAVGIAADSWDETTTLRKSSTEGQTATQATTGTSGDSYQEQRLKNQWKTQQLKGW